MSPRASRRLGALLAIALTVPIWLPGSATAGGRAVMGPRILHGPVLLAGSATAGGRAVMGPRIVHRPLFRARVPRGGNFAPTPFVFTDPDVVVVPEPVAVPVPVDAVPLPPGAEMVPPPPPDDPGRAIVVNPGPKVIDVVRPAPGAKTTTVVVQRGSTTVVETVPLQ
jgi:hypothetical protein